MPKAEDSRKTIVVTGDVTIDWNLARRAPPGIAWGGWHPDLKARARAQRGGAALLADLIEAALARGGADGPQPEVLRMTGTLDPAAPDEERFSHSYAVWGPCETKRGGKRRVWRVEPPIGLDRARTDKWAREEWGRLALDLLHADVIALDDANLGFRQGSDPELWRQVAEGGRNPWLLLKASRPVAEGPLWEHLREHLPERVVALMAIDDLRSAAVQVSRELSWERTAQDLYWELVHNPLVNGLSLCAHVVVSFGAAGAVLLSRTPSDGVGGPTRCRLLFDPEVIEGTWEDERPGAMIGATSCLAASLARELALAGEEPDLAAAINSGVAAGRRLYEEGYGDAESGMDIAFPIAAVINEIVAAGGPLECAEVRDPVAFPPRLPAADGRAAEGEGEHRREDKPAKADGQWTILEDRYTDDLRGVATEVALRGPEVALEAVPLGRFGKLLSVDRGEIESFRSVRALIAEYCCASHPKPLSIAVFGPPGAGKSFAIEQVACSVAPDLASEPLEFNLSQFGSLDDLIDALHRVRDVGLGGKVPLVFWDEFDSPLENSELGWLRYFLAPMQDGEFRHGQLVHPIGRGIFVFAGGTSARMEEFRDRAERTDPSLKAADFLSRLKGYVDILGPDPRSGEADPHHVIRRAILLRSLVARHAGQLLERGELRIDPGVLRAFLETGSYCHGARSMEAILATSRLSGETSLRRSSLPSEAQLDLHVSGPEFLSLVQRIDLEGDVLERLAQAMHAIYCENLPDDQQDYPARVPWDELDDHFKEQNYEAVRDIPEKLRRVGCVMTPARSHDVPFEFTAEEVEKLAEVEHKRYVDAKLADDWHRGPRTHDKTQKTNPTIVSWEELPEKEREKDRDQVRGIPRILARAGYTIVRLSRGAGGQAG